MEIVDRPKVLKKQKVLVLQNEYLYNIQPKIDEILEEGYFIVSVTAQHVSVGSTNHLYGGYLIVFEKSE